MEQDLSSLGIRRIGIIACFNQYHVKHGRFPENPQELNEVTSTLLSEDRFKKHQAWFLESPWGAK